MTLVMRVVLFLTLSLLSSILLEGVPESHGGSHDSFAFRLPSVAASNLAVTKTVLQWSRQLRTCDPSSDSDIESGTTHIIYALGDRDGSVGDETVSFHSAMGVKNVNLMSSRVTPALPSDMNEVALMSRPFVVDASRYTLRKGTYYHCEGLAHTFTGKQHIIRVTPQVDYDHSALVHHMLLFRCERLSEADLAWQGNCYATSTPQGIRKCDQVYILAAWTVGGEEFHYPADVGFPIGGKGPSYFMLQIHYHNPHDLTFTDSAGFVLTTTSTLRKYDAGTIVINHDIMMISIPPKQPAFNLSIYTPSDCLVDVPDSGLNVFASMLHTHEAGVALRTQHFRRGIELPMIDLNERYDFQFQQIVSFAQQRYPKLMSGDNLKLTCMYNTMDRIAVTRGGPATTDEMCMDYLWYYPADYSETSTLAVATGSRINANPGNYTTRCAMVTGRRPIWFNFAEQPVTTPLQAQACNAAAGGARIWGSPVAMNGTTGTVAITAEQWAAERQYYSQSVVLDDAGRFVLYWKVSLDADGANGVIRFTAEVETSGWVGLGLSGSGAMVDSDSVVGWVRTAEEGAASVLVDLTDRYNREYSQPPVDPSQDVFDVRGVETMLPATPPPVNTIYYNTPPRPTSPGTESSTGVSSAASSFGVVESTSSSSSSSSSLVMRLYYSTSTQSGVPSALSSSGAVEPFPFSSSPFVLDWTLGLVAVVLAALCLSLFVALAVRYLKSNCVRSEGGEEHAEAMTRLLALGPTETVL